MKKTCEGKMTNSCHNNNLQHTLAWKIVWSYVRIIMLLMLHSPKATFFAHDVFFFLHLWLGLLIFSSFRFRTRYCSVSPCDDSKAIIMRPTAQLGWMWLFQYLS